MKRLEGKIAIITGASAGIGKASALLFAKEGASLGLIDINLDGGKEICEEIRKNGGKAEFFGIDVSNPEAMKCAFEAVADTYGGIDVLYNNAGGATPRDDYILKMPLDEFDHAIGLNLFGPLLGCRLAIPYMNQRGGGSIINISSIGGLTPEKYIGIYSVSKAALINLTKAMAQDWGGDLIRVNAICPGYIETPIQDYLTEEEIKAATEKTPLPRLGLPSDIGRACVFFASDDAEWITGTALPVDGGWLAPIV